MTTMNEVDKDMNIDKDRLMKYMDKGTSRNLFSEVSLLGKCLLFEIGKSYLERQCDTFIFPAKLYFVNPNTKIQTFRRRISKSPPPGEHLPL